MKYFFGFLVSIGLIVGVFILVLRGFHSTGNNNVVQVKPLVNYSTTDTTMRFSVEGPINADQDHQGFRITVGQGISTMETLKTYNNTVVSTKSYNNTISSYAEFLRALDLSGYTRGTKTATQKDDRGYCATGQRYTFQIIDGTGETKQSFWKSTCGQGSFSGSVGAVIGLFTRQIPDYAAIRATVNLQ